MKKIIVLSIFSMMGAGLLNAQLVHKCGFIDAIEKLDNEFPGIQKQLDNEYLESVQMAKYESLRRNNKYDTVYTLQVVFHVLYNNNLENVHDSTIVSQMEILNADYRRLNADTTVTRDIFKPVAGDAKIQFELAIKDPNGNPTDGINRVYTTNSTFYSQQRSDDMKFGSKGGTDAWDPQKYLNIWVCDYSIPNFGASILGYAYPPRGSRNWTGGVDNISDSRQGVMLHYQIVGRYNRAASSSTLRYAAGRTATHEVGHYLGLRHTWGDGSNRTGCDLDDFIEDTPNERTENGFNEECAGDRNTCIDAQNDLPDMTENYMDYSRNTCQNMFTKQQIAVMRFNLVNLRAGMAANPSLISNPNFIPIEGYFAILDNAVESNFEVYIKDEDADSKSITIRNTIGEVVAEYNNYGKLEGKKIDASFLASGIYYVTVYTSSGAEINTGKLFKK
jgi:hypothetical protein